MYLIFDTSAIGKPTNYKASFSDLNAWPRMLHISWILLDENFKPKEDFDLVAIPEGFTVTEDILTNTKLNEEDVKRKSAPLDEILEKFNETVLKAKYVFAHNLNFNENVLGAEYLRQTIKVNLFKVERYCLMQESTYYCKLPSKSGGYKWPSLPELHAACFGTAYSPHNNARADVVAAARCFIKLMKTGNLEDLFED